MKKFVITIIIICIGLALIGYGLWTQYHNQRQLSFESDPFEQEVDQVELEEGEKVDIITQIRIPSLDLEIPVFDTVIQDGVWEINDDGISHLATSANPGEEGNIILYGHKKNERFRYIPDLNEGDIVTLETWEGKVYAYQVTDLVVTSPDDISEVGPTDYEKLTMYTCYGLVDGDRYIVIAEPKSEE